MFLQANFERARRLVELDMAMSLKSRALENGHEPPLGFDAHRLNMYNMALLSPC